MLVGARQRAEVRASVLSFADPSADDYLVVITTKHSVADRFGWRTLLAATGYAHLLVLAIVSLAVAHGLGPVRVLLLGFVVLSLAMLRKPGWTGVALMVGAAFAVTADALYLGSVTGALHPSSTAQFVTSAGGVLAFTLSVVAAVGCLRTVESGAGADRRAILTAGIGLTAAFAIVSLAIASGVAYDEPVPAAHDVRIRAYSYDCSPRTLMATPGQVSIYIRNEDGSRRAFEIAELGVVLTVPAHRAARTEFTARAGRYTFVCHVPGRGKRIRGFLEVG